MDYQYWVIRYVPNVARGEFSNIGIVCGRDDSDWAVRFDTRFVRNHGNLSSDLRELSPWVAWFRRSIEFHARETFATNAQRVSSGWVDRLRARQANSVQFAAPIPIEASSGQSAVDLLFPHLVERESRTRARTVTRRSMRTDLKDHLLYDLDYQIGKNLFVTPRASVGKQRGSFDLARLDSDSHVCTNVWAFNVAGLEQLEREVQSWNFLVTRLRHDGAVLTKGGETRNVNAQVPIEVVIDAPSIGAELEWRSDIFEGAIEAWGFNNVKVLTVDDWFSQTHQGDLANVEKQRV